MRHQIVTGFVAHISSLLTRSKMKRYPRGNHYPSFHGRKTSTNSSICKMKWKWNGWELRILLKILVFPWIRLKPRTKFWSLLAISYSLCIYLFTCDVQNDLINTPSFYEKRLKYMKRYDSFMILYKTNISSFESVVVYIVSKITAYRQDSTISKPWWNISLGQQFIIKHITFMVSYKTPKGYEVY